MERIGGEHRAIASTFVLVMVVGTLLELTIPPSNQAQLVQEVARRWNGKDWQGRIAHAVHVMVRAGWIEELPGELWLVLGVKDRPITDAMALFCPWSEPQLTIDVHHDEIDRRLH